MCVPVRRGEELLSSLSTYDHHTLITPSLRSSFKGFRLGYLRGYSFLCQPVDYSPTEIPIAIARRCYYYFLVKVLDLLDTIFFVLRKKQNQVSFLHVYHHTGMVMLVWSGVKWFPGGHGVFMGFINSFVHVVMYAYYFLTSANPKYKNNLWWKKYITQLQIVSSKRVLNRNTSN